MGLGEQGWLPEVRGAPEEVEGSGKSGLGRIAGWRRAEHPWCGRGPWGCAQRRDTPGDIEGGRKPAAPETEGVCDPETPRGGAGCTEGLQPGLNTSQEQLSTGIPRGMPVQAWSAGT